MLLYIIYFFLIIFGSDSGPVAVVSLPLVVSLPAVAVDDSRASLMEAIRLAGGSKQAGEKLIVIVSQ